MLSLLRQTIHHLSRLLLHVYELALFFSHHVRHVIPDRDDLPSVLILFHLPEIPLPIIGLDFTTDWILFILQNLRVRLWFRHRSSALFPRLSFGPAQMNLLY